MNNHTLFTKLVEAETEDAVEALLSNAGYLDDDSQWQPIGFENNFAAIGNQQSDPTGALVEKIVNGIDATLMAACFERGIDPEGQYAPRSMAEAVERFYCVPRGQLGILDALQRLDLAGNVHLVAVGSKTNPNYLIIDRGEGQTPAQFPHTLVSLLRSNKMRIPFVQGKFNSGGTGILQFCGDKNFQLIASRRNPACPVDPADRSRELWGFTLVRRLLPAGGRRNSVYVYLAPNGEVLSFRAEAIKVLPGHSRQNHPAPPYAVELPHGTCVKLYNYRWRAKTIITTEGRYELEKFLYAPALPFRLTETRAYNANSYSTTVSGGWISATDTNEAGESAKLEAGFPASAVLSLDGIGRLPYEIAVFNEGTNKRRVPSGVFFVVNGQVHGSLPSNFVTSSLKFSYLTDNHGPLLVSVDCSSMDERVREDFFMASRDRVRRNEVYDLIKKHLIDDLRRHPGLQEVNQRRRQQEMENHLSQDAPLSAFQQLIDSDPTLANLFAAGDHLVTSTGPGEAPPFAGRRFPTYFRLSKEPKGGLVKPCPINRTCRVEFETDAANDYFTRVDGRGEILDAPTIELLEASRLWNGRFFTRFKAPSNAHIGDEVTVTMRVTDPDRQMRSAPFVSTFTMKIEPEAEEEEVRPGGPPRERRPDSASTHRGVARALPNIVEVRREEWEQKGFDEYDGLRVNSDGDDGYDCLVNIDNRHLVDQLARAKDEEKPLIKHWFKFGLVLAAVGMVHNNRRLAAVMDDGDRNGFHTENSGDPEDVDQLAAVSRYCNGLAQVIVPIIKNLRHTPVE